MIRVPRTTFGLVVLLSIALAAAAVIVGSVLLYVEHEEIERRLDRRIADETRTLIAARNTGGTVALVAAIASREQERARGFRGVAYLYVDANGRRLGGRLRATAPPPGWHEFLEIERGGGRGQGHAQSLSTAFADGSRLVVAADRRPVDESDRAIRQITIGIAGSVLFVGIAAAVLLGAVTRRRIDRLNSAAQAIIDGDSALRMPRDAAAGEFDRLAETLNQMLDRNGALIDNLRQVSNDIAHDLRTPLARQQQALEAALSEDREVDGYRAAIAVAADHGREILDLFGALLRISEIESHELRAGFALVDVSEVFERVSEAYRPDIEDTGSRLMTDIASGITVLGDRQLLPQLLANLLENSLRHTPPGTQILVSLVGRPDRIELVVSDNGPGIPDDQHAFVLRRFARLEQARATAGHGLGLSLVEAITKAHGAALTLENAAPGLIVTVCFRTA